jgi:hypothetical protein
MWRERGGRRCRPAQCIQPYFPRLPPAPAFHRTVIVSGVSERWIESEYELAVVNLQVLTYSHTLPLPPLNPLSLVRSLVLQRSEMALE